MARQILVETQSGPYTANGTAASNNEKVNDNFAALDKGMIVVEVNPGSYRREFLAEPDDKDIAMVEAKRRGSFSMGDFELQLTANGVSILNSAPEVVTSIGTTWTELTLSGTPGALSVPAGVPIQAQLTSSSGGTGAAELILRITYAAE